MLIFLHKETFDSDRICRLDLSGLKQKQQKIPLCKFGHLHRGI